MHNSDVNIIDIKCEFLFYCNLFLFDSFPLQNVAFFLSSVVSPFAFVFCIELVFDTINKTPTWGIWGGNYVSVTLLTAIKTAIKTVVFIAATIS